MTAYQWNPAALGNVLVVPAAVAEQHLKLAGPLQLKVLLWFASAGGTIDDAACAAASGYPEADSLDAMH